jgi:hypothetical protein
MHAQARDSTGWTCLHHALSLPDPSPAATAWITTALALQGVAEMREDALHDVALDPAALKKGEANLQLFRGEENAAQVFVT